MADTMHDDFILDDPLVGQYGLLCDTLVEITRAFELRGRWREARNLLKAALDAAPATINPEQIAGLQVIYGSLLWKTGSTAEALSMLRNARHLARTADDLNTLADATYQLGELAVLRGFLMGDEAGQGEALTLHEDARRVRAEIDDARGEMESVLRLALIHAEQGDLQRAAALIDQARRGANALGSSGGSASVLIADGIVALKEGDPARALLAFEGAVPRLALEPDREAAITGSIYQAESLFLLGRSEEARPLAEQALASAEGIEYTLGIARALALLGRLYREADEADQARTCYERLRDLAFDANYKTYVVLALQEIEAAG